MRAWLKEARISRNIYQSDMAEALGVSNPYYSMIESGKRMKTLDLKAAVVLGKMLGMTLEEVARKESLLP